MAGMLTINEINGLSSEDFIELLKNVIEHCPIVAAAIWSQIPFSSVKDVHKAICAFLDALPVEGKAGVLRCHPDLAGRAAAAGTITTESKDEQAGAGLDTLSADEKNTLQTLNDSYKKKFGFPFIICVRQNKKEAIIKGLEQRLMNSQEVELSTGLEEVKKIGYLRLTNILKEDGPKL